MSRLGAGWLAWGHFYGAVLLVITLVELVGFRAELGLEFSCTRKKSLF